ncbi:MAG: response regulator transcription factor [Pseudomonadota bacterium]
MTARLLIVDDDPEITSALARGLSLHGYQAETENRADRAFARLTQTAFDAAIIDVMLGADSGTDLVRQVRDAGVTVPILMLSALSDVEDRAAGLEAGADDYVVKPFHFDELVARLRVQEHRATTHRTGRAQLSAADRTLLCGDVTVAFTEREYELLTLLIDQAQTPMTRNAIFEALWAQDGSGNENVVDVYIGYLRKKLLDVGTSFEIKTIRNKGFCLAGVPPVIKER